MTQEPADLSEKALGGPELPGVRDAKTGAEDVRVERPDSEPSRGHRVGLEPADSTERVRPLVLNIDNDPATRDLKTRLLLTDEMEVIEADDPSAALDLIRHRQPLLVLLETSSVGIEGSDASRRIKTDWPDIIVIQIAAPAVSTAEPAGPPEDGADCYLTTPVEAPELIAVARAMLRLRHAETQAHCAHRRFRTIVDHAVDHAIFVSGQDGLIKSWSAGAQAMLGYAAEDIIGEPCARLFIAEDLTAHGAEAVVPIGQGRSHPNANVYVDRWHRRLDGTRFRSSDRVVPLHDRRGTVTEWLWILVDRSTEKHALEELQALNTQLDDRVAARTRSFAEANEELRSEMAERERTGEQIHQMQKMQALGQLTSGIAHDFNNLLTAIMGGLEVTRRRIDDPRSLKLIDGSISAAQRGAKLIAQLMAFARKQILQVEYLKLNALVNGMEDLLEHSVGPAIRLTYNLGPDVWPVMVDANQLRTALLNLAINARDAMPDGGVLRVTTGNTCINANLSTGDLAPGEYATLALQDAGTGMSDAIMARVFEPFFTTKDVGKGTGLGLAQVYGFVRQSGGDVWVHSVLEEGTTMTILLPHAAPPAEDAGAG